MILNSTTQLYKPFSINALMFNVCIDETIDYLSKQEIGVIIAQGLAETYRSQPKNPVDFLGKWLLHQTKVQAHKESDDAKQKQISEFISFRLRDLKIAELEEQERAVKRKAQDDKKAGFFKKVDDTDDHADILQDLSDYLQEHTGSTSAYIAKLVQEKNTINEDDDDEAHVNEQAPYYLDIYHVSPEGFKFLHRKTIKSNEGVAHDLFKEEEPSPDAQNPSGETEGEGEAEGKEPEEQKPQHFIVDEVVRQPRIKFFKVPRLGSLLCVRLKYESCLLEQALDEAVKDVFDVEDRRRQQEIERGIWEEQEAKRKEEAAKNEQEYEEEQKEWEEIKEKDYITQTVNYAVCLDTMGQDRQFQEDQVDLTLNAISYFTKSWEERERKNLAKDVERRIEKMEEDKYFAEKYKAKFEEIEDRWVEQNLEETEEPKDEVAKNEERKLLRLQFKKKILNAEKIEVRPESPPETKKDDRRDRRSKKDHHKDESRDESKDQQEEEQIDYTEKWKNDLLQLKNYKVIKMPRVIQAILYLLGYSREQICEENTNKLCWKKAKDLITDEFFKRVREYNPVGPKDQEYKKYQKVNFIQKILESLKKETIDNYSLALGQVYQYVQIAVKIRKSDVLKRYHQNVKLREERDQAIEQENERQQERKAWLEAERAKWEAEHQKPEGGKKEGEGEGDDEEKEDEAEPVEVAKFDENEYLAKFDAEKEPIKIPPEVKEDIDNDIELTEEDIQAVNE